MKINLCFGEKKKRLEAAAMLLIQLARPQMPALITPNPTLKLAFTKPRKSHPVDLNSCLKMTSCHKSGAAPSSEWRLSGSSRRCYIYHFTRFFSRVAFGDLWGCQDIYFHFTSCRNKYNKISMLGGGEKVSNHNYTKTQMHLTSREKAVRSASKGERKRIHKVRHPCSIIYIIKTQGEYQ